MHPHGVPGRIEMPAAADAAQGVGLLDHDRPVALAADHLALALTEIGALSERRIALLIDAGMSGLPPFPI